MGAWGVKEDNAAGRRQLEQGMEQRKELEWSQENSEWKPLRRGWCWGPKNFRAAMLERMGAPQGHQHHGAALRASDEQRAERLAGQMVRELGWTETELRQQRKGDRQKARMAARLREETTMSWNWIAKRLVMGHWRTAANAVRAGLKR